jgi:hypothetical protein
VDVGVNAAQRIATAGDQREHRKHFRRLAGIR